MQLLVCTDPSDDLVLGGVYEVVGMISGRMLMESVHAPRISRLLTHLPHRFGPADAFPADAFCACCEGLREVALFRFSVDGFPAEDLGTGPCPVCDGSGVSVRAGRFRSAQGVTQPAVLRSREIRLPVGSVGT
jgi:hypothetical protein